MNQPPSGWYILYSRSGLTESQVVQLSSLRRMVKLTPLLFLLVAVRFFDWTTFISQKYKAQKDCCDKMASLGLTIATTSSQSSSPHPHALAVRLTTKNGDHVGGGKIWENSIFAVVVNLPGEQIECPIFFHPWHIF